MRTRNVKPKPHTAGIVAALTTFAGVALSPAILGILPPKWAAAVTLTGIVAQSLTKAVHQGGTVVVDRDVAEVKGLAKPKRET
jgi:hypothetical protein